MRVILAFLIAVLVAAAVSVGLSAFIVHQNEQAIVLRFGDPKRIIREPGLNWKWPVVDTVEFFDKRILDLDTSEQEVSASDQKRLLVDAFARYRIIDPLEFFKNVRDQNRVKVVLDPIVSSAIRRVLGGATLLEIVRTDRERLMKEIAQQVNREGKDYGIEVVDVRLKRADLPPQNLDSVFSRMRADRVREATELRAQGEAAANRIRADADRQVTVLKADANRRGEEIRGEGDGERSRIFAEAYNRDQEFFSFYRSMLAYEQTMTSKDTRLVISPNSDFFRYFQDATGGAQPKK